MRTNNNSIGPSGEIFNPTIITQPDDKFDPPFDATAVKESLEQGDKKRFIDYMVKRSLKQRLIIAEEYTSITGRHVDKEIKKAFSGNFEKVALTMFQTNGQLLAKRLYRAMKGTGTDEKTLCRIIGMATNKEITEIKEAYKTECEEDLVERVESEVGGIFQRCLIALLQARRNEPGPDDWKRFHEVGISALIDMDAARLTAERLCDAGEGMVGTDEEIFLNILCKESVWQLAAVDVAYREKTSHSILEAIISEFSGAVRDVLKVMLRACLDRPKLIAELLHESIDCVGTDDETLICLLVSRAEIDLGTIRDVYPGVSGGSSLLDDVKGDTSGGYEDFLVALIGQ